MTSQRLAPGALEALARALDLASDHAACDMIVDQAHRLHEGIHGCGPDEFPAQLLQVFREGNRVRRGRHGLRLRKLLRFVTPDEGRQRSFPLDELPGLPRIIDDCLDLAAVTNDPFVLEQMRDISLGEARYSVEIEIMEGGAEILALGEDGAPAQSLSEKSGDERFRRRCSPF